MAGSSATDSRELASHVFVVDIARAPNGLTDADSSQLNGILFVDEFPDDFVVVGVPGSNCPDNDGLNVYGLEGWHLLEKEGSNRAVLFALLSTHSLQLGITALIWNGDVDNDGPCVVVGD